MIGGAKEQTWTLNQVMGILFVVGEGKLPIEAQQPHEISSWIRGTALRGGMQGTMRCQVEFPQWESHCVCRVQGSSPVGREEGGPAVGLSWSLGSGRPVTCNSHFHFNFHVHFHLHLNSSLDSRLLGSGLHLLKIHNFSTSSKIELCPFGLFQDSVAESDGVAHFGTRRVCRDAHLRSSGRKVLGTQVSV